MHHIILSYETESSLNKKGSIGVKYHPLPPCHVASIWRGWWLQLCGKVIHRLVSVSLGTVLVCGGVSGGVV